MLVELGDSFVDPLAYRVGRFRLRGCCRQSGLNVVETAMHITQEPNASKGLFVLAVKGTYAALYRKRVANTR